MRAPSNLTRFPSLDSYARLKNDPSTDSLTYATIDVNNPTIYISVRNVPKYLSIKNSREKGSTGNIYDFMFKSFVLVDLILF